MRRPTPWMEKNGAVVTANPEAAPTVFTVTGSVSVGYALACGRDTRAKISAGIEHEDQSQQWHKKWMKYGGDQFGESHATLEFLSHACHWNSKLLSILGNGPPSNVVAFLF